MNAILNLFDALVSGFHTLFWAIVVLGAIIFFHELGHFLVARLFKVRVLTFSLGFGPKIWSWQRSPEDTEYQLAAIPLGGYVKMLGEGEEEEEIPAEQKPHAFASKSVGPRFAIVLAGPVFNFILSVLILWAGFYLVGVREALPLNQTPARVGAISPGMPAKAAGLQKGDLITHLDGQPVPHWEWMSHTIKSTAKENGGGPIAVRVERTGVHGAQDQILTFDLTPQMREISAPDGTQLKRALIGVSAEMTFNTIRMDNPLDALHAGAERTWEITVLTWDFLGKLVTQAVSASNIGGPLLIAGMAGEKASQGAPDLLEFMAIISINLGILNLLPIPVLDGGHLLFFSIEAIKGSPVGPNAREWAMRVGLLALLSLMALALYNDIVRLFL